MKLHRYRYGELTDKVYYNGMKTKNVYLPEVPEILSTVSLSHVPGT